MSFQQYRAWESPACFIAEAGVNHGGDLDQAIEMVRLAARAGVDAIKFQTYKASRIASRNSQAYWDTSLESCQSQFELFSRYDRLDPGDYRRLAEECAERGIVMLSTPFDVDCVDWLDDLVPAYKIASADVTNFVLLERVARTQKPALLSTGASTVSEIEEAVAFLRNHGCPEVVPLHCTLAYPTHGQDAHIGTLVHLRGLFPDCPLGYSDHTTPADSFTAFLAAYTLGARVFEKHFTFDKSLPGNDHYHAFDRDDFIRARRELEHLRVVLGHRTKTILPCETLSRLHARRSLVARQRILAGTRVTAEMIDVKRPGTGIETRYLDTVVGLTAACDIAEDETLQWFMLSRERQEHLEGAGRPTPPPVGEG